MFMNHDHFNDFTRILQIWKGFCVNYKYEFTRILKSPTKRKTNKIINQSIWIYHIWISNYMYIEHKNRSGCVPFLSIPSNFSTTIINSIVKNGMSGIWRCLPPIPYYTCTTRWVIKARISSLGWHTKRYVAGSSINEFQVSQVTGFWSSCCHFNSSCKHSHNTRHCRSQHWWCLSAQKSYLHYSLCFFLVEFG